MLINSCKSQKVGGEFGGGRNPEAAQSRMAVRKRRKKPEKKNQEALCDNEVMATQGVAVSVRIRPGAFDDDCVAPRPGGEGGVTVAGTTFGYPSAVITGSDQASAAPALIGQLVQKFIKGGVACTLMAYGQTGSGKTYTMFGPAGALTEASVTQAGGAVPDDWGAFPRAMMELLATPELAGATFHASAIEIYMDQAYDLLDGRKGVKIGSAKGAGRGTLVAADMDKGPVYSGDVLIVGGLHPSGCSCFNCFKKTGGLVGKKKEVPVARNVPVPKLSKAAAPPPKKNQEAFGTEGETQMPIKAPADVAKLARLVESERSAAGHNLNERSSRSHCLVRVSCTHVDGAGKSAKRAFLFVDLAGSERISKSGVVGINQKEATNINQSLTALGRVIKEINERSSHVSYRDSGLTMLLRASFDGPSAAAAVICVRGDQSHAEETTCSLRFGEKLASVKTLAVAMQATDVGADRQRVAAELHAARMRLDELTRQGQADRVGTPADAVGLPRPPTASEQATLRKNLATVEERAAEVRALKVKLVEAKAASPASVADITERLENATLAHGQLEAIVWAQQTIKGLWVPGTPAWKRARDNVNTLQGQLDMLGGLPSLS